MGDSPTRRIASTPAASEAAAGGEGASFNGRGIIKPRNRALPPPRFELLLQRLLAVALAFAIVFAVIKVRHRNLNSAARESAVEETNQSTFFSPLSFCDLDPLSPPLSPSPPLSLPLLSFFLSLLSLSLSL